VIAGVCLIKLYRSFENVSQFKYLGRTVTKQNLIQEDIKRRLKYSNACYHSKRMRWAGHVARIAEKRNTYRLFVVKPEGMRPGKTKT
jgi:hypothetical protein